MSQRHSAPTSSRPHVFIRALSTIVHATGHCRIPDASLTLFLLKSNRVRSGAPPEHETGRGQGTARGLDKSMTWKHPTATVDPGAHIGEGTKIWHYSHVCGEQVSIGEGCTLGQNVYVGPRVRIGKGCRIQNNVSVYDLVELDDYVFCGPSVVFTNVINPRAHIPRKDEFKKTRVHAGATLGANATIVCGVEIGRFAFVAAGALVSKSVKEFAIVQGVPARQVGWMCHCGIRLKLKLGAPGREECASCHSLYQIGESTCEAVQLKLCFVSK